MYGARSLFEVRKATEGVANRQYGFSNYNKYYVDRQAIKNAQYSKELCQEAKDFIKDDDYLTIRDSIWYNQVNLTSRIDINTVGGFVILSEKFGIDPAQRVLKEDYLPYVKELYKRRGMGFNIQDLGKKGTEVNIFAYKIKRYKNTMWKSRFDIVTNRPLILEALEKLGLIAKGGDEYVSCPCAIMLEDDWKHKYLEMAS